MAEEKQWLRLAGDTVMEQDPAWWSPSLLSTGTLARGSSGARRHLWPIIFSANTVTPVVFPFCPNFPNQRRRHWVGQQHICFGLAGEQ